MLRLDYLNSSNSTPSRYSTSRAVPALSGSGAVIFSPMLEITPTSPTASADAALLARAEAFVRERCVADSGGHDFHHIRRVRALALRIGRAHGADPLITELAAVLHDVADPKLNDTQESGLKALAGFLEGCGLDAARRARVEAVIERVSFGRELDGAAEPKSIELQAVQDADRIDALGAIGIARTFAYGGSKGQPMHDPDLPPRIGLDQKAYRSGKSTSVNHFHEKLFTLKARLNTDTGRAIAGERHNFMEAFLDRFMAEWEGAG